MICQLKRPSALLATTAGTAAILLWMMLVFFNPYSSSLETRPLQITFFTLCVPAALAIVSAWFRRRTLLLIAFLWSLPISLYLAMTPGIFALFGATSCAYLVSYFLMLAEMRR
ncbi:hypothetical protein FHS19_005453 [Paenibacillus rhizosphaerae]|uniref:DUF2069 domain-containing protein n=1 Tax=Paenibacillus rhizosphaerae TaxID=297318 RepID=A0A839TUC4_9BACL|nr:hypothetical protein [Paenibacillus rhizosphaerae]MBB3130734.1 hypothetical protein [Paenibacillus rhizosphaerae]